MCVRACMVCMRMCVLARVRVCVHASACVCMGTQCVVSAEPFGCSAASAQGPSRMAGEFQITSLLRVHECVRVCARAWACVSCACMHTLVKKYACACPCVPARAHARPGGGCVQSCASHLRSTATHCSRAGGPTPDIPDYRAVIFPLICPLHPAACIHVHVLECVRMYADRDFRVCAHAFVREYLHACAWLACSRRCRCVHACGPACLGPCMSECTLCMHVRSRATSG